MKPIHFLIAAIGLLMFAGQAVAQETRVAAAADADVIALFSQHVDRGLLRVRFDRTAGRISLLPFGPSGVEHFAVAPNGAFIVYSSTRDQVTGSPMTYLSLLDEAGHALGEPLRSPIGAITRLAVSPRGDRIAVSSDKGWMAVLAVQGTGAARRLAVRAEFGVRADRQFTFAFRPDGGLVTLVADWVASWRSNDGVLQRSLDLKTINRDLRPADQDIEGGLFQLTWSPRDDRFSVSWGAGPMFTFIFDSSGRRLKLAGPENDFGFGASKVEFVDGGNAMILYGMQAAVLLSLKSLAPTAFGDPGLPATSFTALAGGREIAVVAGERIALLSVDGKSLAGPVGLENYSLGATAAGAKGEMIVAAERGGWIELYTRDGKYLRRVQSGTRERHGFVALSADGSTVAALGADGLGSVAELHGRAWATALDNGPLVAVAANGSRVVTEGPDRTLRSWSRGSAGADSIPLKAGEKVPGRRLSGIALSTDGDAIAVAEDGSAVWLADPADKSVVRLAVAARSVAPLPDGAGFAIGLADGMAVRISRDGTVRGPPLKVLEGDAVGRIVVAPDGQSLIAVDGDGRNARHLAWDGKVPGVPFRASPSETIDGAFFDGGSPRLILRNADAPSDERFAVVTLATPGARQVRPLKPPN